ncbi:hypothetical protein FIBSPDRAFT_874471 [Athelia psychrophila]|uniref:Uncharacterized protein n=1 Tax=Athelia psychrophila TaxID=1759441 RepID=A0A165XGZ3_9AGAM|nr:hypothetical protein FIBSPDRAFT_874471 [Fibularhizoctonia sp. CBS 109695]
MLTRQLLVYPSAVTADPQLQISPPALYANVAVLTTAPNGIPPSVYAATSSHSQPPLPVQHQSLNCLRSPRVGLRRNPSHPPGVLIQDAHRSTGASSLAALTAHPVCVSHRAFPASAYAAAQEVPLQAPHPNHDYANHNSAFSLVYPGGPNRAASTVLRCSS